jgi:hypothetical protein
MVALRNDAAKYADQKEAARQKKARQRAASRDTDVENIEEKPKNAVGKDYSESYDPSYKLKHTPPSISRLYAPQHGRLPFKGDGQEIEAKEESSDPEASADARRAEYAESEGVTQDEIFAQLCILWSAATEATRVRFVEKEKIIGVLPLLDQKLYSNLK